MGILELWAFCFVLFCIREGKKVRRMGKTMGLIKEKIKDQSRILGGNYIARRDESINSIILFA